MYLAPVNLHDSLNKMDYRFLIYGKTIKNMMPDVGKRSPKKMWVD
jgi:hypothetical protein